MSLNMHLFHSLMNRSNLFGVGLGVYWAIVLVAGYRTHAGSELGGMEMMKRVGGQSSNGRCYPDGSCNDEDCPACTSEQIGTQCQSSLYEGQYPQQCNTNVGNQYCNTGNPQDVLCQIYYPCDCVMDDEGTGYSCEESYTTENVYCKDDFDVGTNIGCPYELCP